MRLGISGDDSVISGTGGSTGNLVFKTYGSERMRINSSGNVGIGVTPSNAFVDSRAIEIGANGTIWSEQTSSIYNSIISGIGFYYNAAGATIYKTTSLQISRYVQYQGEHLFQYAAAGTAGGAITWSEAFRTSDTGNVGIGTTSPESLLAVKGGTAVSDLFSISDNTVPTSGAEYGVMMIKTASVEYALNVTAYGLTSKGLRVYNNGAL